MKKNGKEKTMTFTGNKAEINQFLFKLDKDIIYDLKIEKHRNKRSLNANNYAWKLISEIARKMITTKEDIYLKMLSDYGILKESEWGEIIECYLSPNVNLSALGSYWKFIEYVNLNNEVKMKCYLLKGSSEYNSKEMYDFIKGIEQEAKQLEIETLEELELKKMIKEMDRNE